MTKSGLVEEKGKRKREDEGISDGVTDGGGKDGRAGFRSTDEAEMSRGRFRSVRMFFPVYGIQVLNYLLLRKSDKIWFKLLS